MSVQGPSDWISGPLGSFMPLQRGFDLPTTDVTPGKVPVVYSNGVGRYHNRAMVKGPGVVTGRSGTIGKIHFVDVDYWPHNTSLWVTRFDRSEPQFTYYFLQYLGLKRFASGSGVPTLNRNDVHSFTISIPASSCEQRAISTALGDVDGLIASLEHLIAKKQEIKQGLMQELLSGKSRLPGQSDTWSVVRLNDVATGGRGAGLSKSSVDSNGRTPCLLYGELFTTYDRVIESIRSFTVEGEGVKSAGGEVLVPGSTTTTAKDLATASALLQRGVRIGGDVNIIRPNQLRVDSAWLAYYLTNQRKSQIAEAGQGITIVHLYVRSLLGLAIDLPPLPEQIAIASVLRDADSEIAALERRLESARAIKQGMMQELLTGRTRLTEEVTV